MAKDVKFNIKLLVDGNEKLVQASANVQDLAKNLGIVYYNVNAAEKAFAKWGTSVVAIQSLQTTVQSLSGAMQILTGESLSFGKAMKATNTMAGKDAAGFAKLKDDVTELSKQIPIARDQLANGLYMVISNGVPEDNWINYLEKSAKASVGGIADLQKTVTVTSTIIKNYGLEWEAAGEIQDKIQLTAKYGVTSFEQLADALPRVAGSAAQLGVTIDELMSVFATCTGVTGNTAEVSTQLAAVLNALVKPSSEATAAAEKMGVKFNAAAIKEAGGLAIFLRSLDKAINEYSARTGELSETIYGNLFGSAEALRVLTSLTGEQAAKFSQNIGEMTKSTGTIEGAFEEMSSTGSAKLQMLENGLGEFRDLLSGVFSNAMPVLNFAATIGTIALTFESLRRSIVAAAVALNKILGISLLWNSTAVRMRALVQMLSATFKGAAVSATTMKYAIQGLMILGGITAIVGVLAGALSLFSSSAKEATGASKDLKEAENAYRDTLTESMKAVADDIDRLQHLIDTKADTTAAVKNLNEKYGDLLGTYQSGTEWLTELRKKSDEYCQQLAFEAKADTIRRKIFEKNADLMIIAERKRHMEQEGKRYVADFRTTGGTYAPSMVGQYHESKEFVDLTNEEKAISKDIASLNKEMDIANAAAGKFKSQLKSTSTDAGKTGSGISYLKMSYSELGDAITKQKSKVEGLAGVAGKEKEAAKEAAELKKMEARYDNLGKKYNLATSGKKTNRNQNKSTIVADTTELGQLRTNIELAQKKLTGQDTEEQRVLQKQIQKWKKKVNLIELAKKKAAIPEKVQTFEHIDKLLEYLNAAKQLAETGREIAAIDKQIQQAELQQAELQRPENPKNLETLQQVSNELEYQRALRKTASAEQQVQIDAVINRLEVMQQQMEHAGVIQMDDAALTTYDQLSIKVQYYQECLQHATAANRSAILKHISDLEKIRETWELADQSTYVETDARKLSTLKDISAAISLLQEKQNAASADEIGNIQKQITALEKKQKALQLGIELPSMQREIADIQELTGRERRVKIKGMGFDELTAKIKELNKLLHGTENPVTAEQRKDIEDMISTYERWRKQTVYSFDTVTEGWNGVKGIGDSIQNITDALEGNGNAWQTITGIIDGFIQLYQGIQSIISIIDMFTASTTAHTVAEVADKAAQSASAATAGAEIGTLAAETAAAKVATQGYMELASARYFAAHASIPFIGLGLATGFATAAVAAVQAIGATPFAEGGVVSGPTMALIGEYAGASHNPEVVAPLDKLRNMIQPAGGMGGTVHFEIEGRKLVGVIANETRVSSRSGRRTNIVV